MRGWAPVLLAVLLSGCYREVVVHTPELQKLRYPNSGQTARLVSIDGDLVEVSSYRQVRIVTAKTEETIWELEPPVRAVSQGGDLWLHSPTFPPVQPDPASRNAVIVYRDGGRTAAVATAIVAFAAAGLFAGAELGHDSLGQDSNFTGVAGAAIGAGVGAAVSLPLTKRP